MRVGSEKLRDMKGTVADEKVHTTKFSKAGLFGFPLTARNIKPDTQ